MFSRVAGYAHNNLLKLSIQSLFRHCLLQRLSLCKGIRHPSFFCLVEGEKICYERPAKEATVVPQACKALSAKKTWKETQDQ